MSTRRQSLLFSLKHQYAELIFNGSKEVELRRCIASCMENRNVFIYVSSPVKQLYGGFRIGQVWSETPGKVWRQVSKLTGVKKRDFDSYYAGQTVAYALEIKDVWRYKNPVDLSTLEGKFANFTAPQSWRYVRAEEHRSFARMKRLTEKS